jgi:hypothetical protein
MRALLGDLCLWAGRYEEAARWYHDYLTDRERPIALNHTNRIQWQGIADFQRPRDAYSITSTRELLSFVPMDTRVFDGTVSDLPNVYNSTTENNYYYQLTPSSAMRGLSAAQIYCIEYQTETATDTLYAPRTGLQNELLVGDLRLYSNYSVTTLGGQDSYSEVSNEYQNINKVWSSVIPTYRRTMVYLRYAEALNRCGLPQSAMLVLKYGMSNDNVKEYVDSLEQLKAGSLITFDANVFPRNEAIGIHSLGSGDSQANAYYTLPMPARQLATRQDTVDYQIPLVEDMIIDEMALEGAFEGYRFFDLMRVALRRGDPAYLADPVSRRGGAADDQLRALLMDTKNWYLPLP